MKSFKSLTLALALTFPSITYGATFIVSDVADSGANTLRQAITDANGSVNAGGPDVIEFNIPGGGVQTITPLTVLPTITDPVIIDGYTQPGASANTQGPDQGSNAVILIELVGSNLANLNGLNITAGDSSVRGLAINRFGTGGIFGSAIALDSTNNIVEGCFLGTDASGTQALPNLTRGVFVTDDSNTIGGLTPATRNLISGNGERGIFIITGISNAVTGNLIGTDITGTQALGNGAEGVHIQSSTNNQIGGTTPEERNIISGNDGAGIEFFSQVGVPASDNLIQGNYIGTDVGGTQGVGNGVGIIFGGTIVADNLVGGTGLGEGNLIAFNVDEGVFVSQGTGMAILGNSIHSNGALGIELGAGANNDQPAPVLTAAALNGGLSVQGTLNAAANTEYSVELFTNDQCDASGAGEGQSFLGRVSVTTDGSGLANIDFALAASFQIQFSSAAYSAEETDGSAVITVTRTLPAIPSGGVITATATDPGNNTSEFSNCQATSGSSEASVDFATSDGTATAGVDYEATSGTLTFAAGEISKDFEIPLLTDNIAEADETVDLTLSNPSTGAELADPSAAVLTIVNTDAPGGAIQGGGCSLGGGTAVSWLPLAGLWLVLMPLTKFRNRR